MSTALETNLRTILQEKTDKIIPDNIKSGVTILGVQGTVTPARPRTYSNTTSDPKLDTKIYKEDITSVTDNEFYWGDYVATFNRSTKILNIKSDTLDTNIDFSTDISAKTGYSFGDCNIGMKIHNSDTERYVYISYFKASSSYMKTTINVDIYSCDFATGTKQLAYNDIIGDYQNYGTVSVCKVRPSMYSLSFMFQMRYPNSSYYGRPIYAVGYDYINDVFIPNTSFNIGPDGASGITALDFGGGGTLFVSPNCFKSNYTTSGTSYIGVVVNGTPTMWRGTDALSNHIIIGTNKAQTKVLLSTYTGVVSSVKIADLNITKTNLNEAITNVRSISLPSQTYIGYATPVFQNGNNELIFNSTSSGVSSSGEYKYNIKCVKFDFETETFEVIKQWQYTSTTLIKPEELIVPRPDNFDVGENLYKYNTSINKLVMKTESVVTGMTIDNKTWYNIDDLYKNTLQSEVLSDRFVVLNGGVTRGTMPNNGSLNYTPTTSSQVIPLGYTAGGTIEAVTSSIDANIMEGNIKSGITILGVTGTYNPYQIREYSSETAMNNDIANISEGEVVKVVAKGLDGVLYFSDNSVVTLPNMPQGLTEPFFIIPHPVVNDILWDLIVWDPTQVKIVYSLNGNYHMLDAYNVTGGSDYFTQWYYTEEGGWVNDYGPRQKQYLQWDKRDNKPWFSTVDLKDSSGNIKLGMTTPITYYIKETTMKKLVKEEDTISPEEYEDNIDLVNEILGE